MKNQFLQRLVLITVAAKQARNLSLLGQQADPEVLEAGFPSLFVRNPYDISPAELEAMVQQESARLNLPKQFEKGGIVQQAASGEFVINRTREFPSYEDWKQQQQAAREAKEGGQGEA